MPFVATSSAWMNCPSWVPEIPALQPPATVQISKPVPALRPSTSQPHILRKPPLALNFWTRRLNSSATYTLPTSSTATPGAPLNWPAPGPTPPHARGLVPSRLNRWMRLLPSSAT